MEGQIPVTPENIRVGMRVVRGKDWSRCSADRANIPNGNHNSTSIYPGTVIYWNSTSHPCKADKPRSNSPPEGCAHINWDFGEQGWNSCIGQRGRYALYIAPDDETYKSKIQNRRQNEILKLISKVKLSANFKDNVEKLHEQVQLGEELTKLIVEGDTELQTEELLAITDRENSTREAMTRLQTEIRGLENKLQEIEREKVAYYERNQERQRKFTEGQNLIRENILLLRRKIAEGDLVGNTPIQSTSSSILNGHSSNPSAPFSPSNVTSSSSTNTKDCCFCENKPATFAVVPCGHKCICSDCSTDLSTKFQNKCPICRNSITMAMQIFEI